MREPTKTSFWRLQALVADRVLASAVAACRRGAASAPEVERSRIAILGRSVERGGVDGRIRSRPSRPSWTASTDDTADVYISRQPRRRRNVAAPARVNDVERRSPRVPESRPPASTGWLPPCRARRLAGEARGPYRDSCTPGRKIGAGRSPRRVTIAPGVVPGARGWHAATLGNDGARPSGVARRRGTPAPMAHAHGKGQRPSQCAHAGGPRPGHFPCTSWKGDRLAAGRAAWFRPTSVSAARRRVAPSGEKVYAAWRHIYPGSLRDIAVARLDDNGADIRRSDSRQRGRVEDRRLSRGRAGDGGGRARGNPHRRGRRSSPVTTPRERHLLLDAQGRQLCAARAARRWRCRPGAPADRRRPPYEHRCRLG